MFVTSVPDKFSFTHDNIKPFGQSSKSFQPIRHLSKKKKKTFADLEPETLPLCHCPYIMNKNFLMSLKAYNTNYVGMDESNGDSSK